MKVVLGLLWFALGPTVAVEVEPPLQPGAGVDPALRPWLVQRLLEEEQVEIVGSPRDADAVVRLRGRQDGGVDVRGRETFVVDPGPPAVMNLEVLHRARSVVEVVEVADVASARPTGPRVTVTCHGEAPPGSVGLVHTRLLNAGFTLTPEPRSDAATVCVWFEDDPSSDPSRTGADPVAFRVTVAGPSERCGENTITIEHATLQRPGGADPLVAWIHRSMGASFEQPRAHDDELPPLASRDDEPEGDWLHADVGTVRSVGAGSPWWDSAAEVRFMAEGGVRVHPEAEGSFFTRGRAGRASGPGGTVAVQVNAYRRDGQAATDTVIAAGPDWHVRFRKRLGVEVAAVAGAEIHVFDRLLRRGGIAGFYAGLPVSFSIGLSEQARAHLSVEPAYSQAVLEQYYADDVDFVRTAWSVRAGLGISYGWRIR